MAFLLGGRKPTYLTSATSVLTSVKAVSVVPSGGNKTDVRRENTDVRWVGFHPLFFYLSALLLYYETEISEI